MQSNIQSKKSVDVTSNIYSIIIYMFLAFLNICFISAFLPSLCSKIVFFTRKNWVLPMQAGLHVQCHLLFCLDPSTWDGRLHNRCRQARRYHPYKHTHQFADSVNPCISTRQRLKYEEDAKHRQVFDYKKRKQWILLTSLHLPTRLWWRSLLVFVFEKRHNLHAVCGGEGWLLNNT